jgi:hypothetical protein
MTAGVSSDLVITLTEEQFVLEEAPLERRWRGAGLKLNLAQSAGAEFEVDLLSACRCGDQNRTGREGPARAAPLCPMRA